MQVTDTSQNVRRAVSLAVDQVCRYSVQQPGFAILDLGTHSDSKTLRKLMIQMRDALNARHRSQTGRSLDFYWLGRFNQQSTTKFHRDNAPEESILLLGYEPTTVESRLTIADYSKTAARFGVSPREFLEKNNPMFAEGERGLVEDIAVVGDYDITRFQLAAINNSDASPGTGRLLGVLHKAEILKPDPSASRIINSGMLAAPENGQGGWMVETEVQTFLETETVSQGHY